MKHLLIINASGERVTTLVEGIHAPTLEELKEQATKEYEGCLLVEDDGTLQEQLCDGTKLYVNGEVIDKPPYEPTPEELKAQAMSFYEKQVAEYNDQLMKASLRDDTAVMTDIKEEFKGFQAYYDSVLASGDFSEFLAEMKGAE